MLTDLAFGLAAGAPAYDIVVLTSRLTYEKSATPLPARETARGVSIVRVPTTRFGRAFLPGRAIDYLTFYLMSALALARLARGGDLVVIKTDPPLLSLIIHPIARLKRARVVNWLQDLYPEAAQALGLARGPLGPVVQALKPLRNASLHWADANVVLGRHMASRVRKVAPYHPAVLEIPNWADGEVIRPLAREANRLRTAWGLEEAFVVAYSGNLGRAHETATLVSAMAQLALVPAHQRLVWLFIGGGARIEALRAEVARLGLRNVLFQPYQPRARLAESLSVADVQLVTLQPALEGLIVPSKLYGVMAAGRATIFVGAPDGEVAHALEAHACGATIRTGDGAALAELLRGWSRDRDHVDALGRNARRAFEALYDKPHALAKWTKLINRIAEMR